MKTIFAIVASAVTMCAAAPQASADLVMTDGAQDGFVNDGQYSRTGEFILVGEEGFAGVFEFQLKNKQKVKKATLILNIKKVKKKGECSLYHLLSFNNGEAEVQDFYAGSDLVEKKTIDGDGPVEFDITAAVNEDIDGPGEWTSFRLNAEGDTQVVVHSFEGNAKEAARIVIER